jgi:hypothetical protein
MNTSLRPILFVITLLSFMRVGANASTTINPILGDVSLSAKGLVPSLVNEQTRIRTHLLYVEQLLRERSDAPLRAQAKRIELLDHLHRYAEAGVFPANVKYDDRTPCFIDDGGNICAVGYLVEQTAGRAAAEAINAKHQYDELLAMNEPALDAWAAESGFTLTELAMIQPTYDWKYTEPIRGIEIQLARQPLLTFSIQAGAQENAGDGLNTYYPLLGAGFRVATTQAFFVGLEANYHRISDNVMQNSAVLDLPLLVRAVDPYLSFDAVAERRYSPVYFELGPVTSLVLQPFANMNSLAFGAIAGVGLQWDLTDPTPGPISRLTQMSLSTRFYQRFTKLLPQNDIWRRISVQVMLAISR